MKRWGRLAVDAARKTLRTVAGIAPVRATIRHGINVGVALAGVWLLDRAVHDYLAHRPELRVHSPRLDWGGRESADMTRGIDATLGAVDAPANDDTLIPRLAESLARDPWVRRLHGIRRVYPNHFELDVEFRRPFVAVRHGDGYVLLDEQAVRLPGRFEGEPPDLAEPAIVGTMMAPPEPGRRWKGREIAVAFELLELRRRSLLGRLPVVEMDVSNLDGRIRPYQCEVVFRLSNGCELLWGSPPSATRPLWEADVEQKLANLKMALDGGALAEGRTIHLFTPGEIRFAMEQP